MIGKTKKNYPVDLEFNKILNCNNLNNEYIPY